MSDSTDPRYSRTILVQMAEDIFELPSDDAVELVDSVIEQLAPEHPGVDENDLPFEYLRAMLSAGPDNPEGDDEDGAS